MNWRLAYALATLRDQVNVLYPSRSKASDGTIGDTAHQATKSEHNPNAEGVVTAIDLTHDPANGADMHKVAELLLRSQDSRIWYVIFNGRIWEGGVWTPYYGDNPHDKHLHLSVKQDKLHYDDDRPWQLTKEEETMTPYALNLLAQIAWNRPVNSEDKFVKGYTGKSVEKVLEDVLRSSENLMLRTKGANFDALQKALDEARKQDGTDAVELAPGIYKVK